MNAASMEAWEQLQNIPKNRQLHLECKTSMGAMAVNSKPMIFIKCIMHPLDNGPASEEVVLNLSIEDARVLKRTIDRTLAAVDAQQNN